MYLNKINFTQDHNLKNGTFIFDESNLMKARMLKIENISLELKLHQKLALMYMQSFEKNEVIYIKDTNISIKTNYLYYCDPTGSGKSIVLLSLILNSTINKQSTEKKIKSINQYNICETQNTPRSEIYLENVKTRRKYFMSDLSVIVVPHNIILQWENYIQQDTCNVPYFMVHKKCDLKKFNINFLKKTKILLVSNSKFNFVSELLSEVTIARLIIDEIDTINIPNADDRFDAKYYYFISSSIQNIKLGHVKNNGFLKNIVGANYYNFRNEYTEHDTVIFRNNIEFIENSLKLPSLHHHIIKCFPDRIHDVLNGFLHPDLMRMLNAEAHNDIMNYFNIEETSEKNLIHIICKQFEVDLQNKKLELEMTSRMIQSQDIKERRLTAVTKSINEIQNKIETIKRRILTNEIDPITLEPIPENFIITKCCHNKFLTDSLLRCLSMQNRCPVCRSEISSNDILYVNENRIKRKKKLNKFDQLQLLFDAFNKEDKILIFSQYDNSFLKIQDICKSRNKTFSYLKGTAFHIQTLLQQYELGNLDILLLNARNYASGMNLENTDRVILFHKMSEDIEMQIIGRANRLNRKKELNVYKLVYETEI